MLGYEVEVVCPEVDEESVRADTPRELVEKLSRLKAEAVTVPPSEDRPLLAADTLVELNGKILGKPHTPEEATAMLTSLSGNSHYVHTGYTVLRHGKAISGVESTLVHFRSLTDKEIAAYVASGHPMDKAGAYGIQGPAGAFIDRIEGDYYTVVGLPLSRISELLQNEP